MNKQLFFPLLLLAAWVIFGSFLCKKYLCDSTPVPNKAATLVPEIKTPVLKNWTPSSLIIEDGVKFKTAAPRHFDFLKSNYSFLTPLSTGVDASVKSAVDYLKNNSGRSLVIKGLYKAEEKNSSVFPNLGLARANNVKKIFTDLGVSGNQLVTSSELIGKDFTLMDTVWSAARFAFADISDDLPKRLAAIKKRLSGKPIVLYFQTNSDQLNLSAGQQKDFADLVFYLDNVAKSKLEVSGHTDDRGDVGYNERLSRKRADFVMQYLKGNGLSGNRMKVQGFGPDKPIQSNETPEGRAKNRRVEVRLR